MKRVLLATAMAFLVASSSAWAAPVSKQIPMTFQTTLSPGINYNFTFGIYDAPGTTATRLWAEGPIALKVHTNGSITHTLGAIRPFGARVDFSKQLWVQWAGGGERKRIKLGVAAYAMYSLMPGPAGKTGLACWDLNVNGKCDIDTEDADGSGTCDAIDCQGPKGNEGDQGPPGLTWHGAWAADVVYVPSDAVSFGGSAWVSITGDNVGYQPDLSPAQWALLARAGEQGTQGPPGIQGSPGPQGDVGPSGPAGSPDTPSQVLEKLLGTDGPGSALDADLLDGYHATHFLDASQINAGSLDGNYFSAYPDLEQEGYLDGSETGDLVTVGLADQRYASPGEVQALVAALEQKINNVVNASPNGSGQLIEHDDAGGVGATPRLAINSNGDAIAVWSQSDGVRYNLWANRFRSGLGWGTPRQIETYDGGNVGSPEVGIDDAGNAIAVWIQSDGSPIGHVWANRFDAIAGWGLPEMLESVGSSDIRNQRIAVNKRGDAVVIWAQQGAIGLSVWAKRYSPASGWATAALMVTDGTGPADCPDAAIDENGNAMAVWAQWDASGWENIYASRSIYGSGWAVPQLIESDNQGDARFPLVAYDAQGTATAVWYHTRQSPPAQYIYANRFSGGAWGVAGPIGTHVGVTVISDLAVGPAGNAAAVWYHNDGVRYNIWANVSSATGVWGTAQLLEADNTGSAYTPRVAMDGAGNAVALWHQNDGVRTNVYMSRYTGVTGWGPRALIEYIDTGNASSPDIAANFTGTFLALWIQSDGTRYNLWARRLY